MNASGKSTWQGGRDLASTAEYTMTFCRAVRACWEARCTALHPGQVLFDDDIEL